ncbi:hypothetical protein BDV36DRAFT_274340 [Aspergillus pseudocaelatus]|uniref:Uncharacterized protein n=1 Tax=Aspergillus pseudocaelatus TaxID=1825620 RepID=A0ABQ6W2Z9_9EURO|nr:hypothetical protein BDV36DRAFT_274340 [Aspergillus pseudocaelatus]
MVNRYSRLTSTCSTQSVKMGLSPAAISLWVMQTSRWKSHVLCILLVILPESKLKSSGFVRMESRS